jgi:hypothetical protein
MRINATWMDVVAWLISGALLVLAACTAFL